MLHHRARLWATRSPRCHKPRVPRVTPGWWQSVMRPPLVPTRANRVINAPMHPPVRALALMIDAVQLALFFSFSPPERKLCIPFILINWEKLYFVVRSLLWLMNDLPIRCFRAEIRGACAAMITFGDVVSWESSAVSNESAQFLDGGQNSTEFPVAVCYYFESKLN